MYDYPEINRSVHINAADSQQAILRAVLDQQLPISYARDHQGNMQPVFWKMEMAGQTRWPRIEKNNRLVWQGRHHQGQLRFEVEEIS